MIAALELATDRLLLRQWQESDFAALATMLADESSSFIGGPLAEDQAWRLLAATIGHWHLKGYGLYCIEEKASSAFVGWCGLLNTPDKVEPELAWALTPTMRRKGYAVEAAARVRRHVYADLQWPTLMSLIDPANSASQKIAQKLGAKAEGEQMFRGKLITRWRHLSPQEVAG